VFNLAPNRSTYYVEHLLLIPISRQIFWGPMAYAMIGGIIAGTVITLFFAPALYLAVFRVKCEDDQDAKPDAAAAAGVSAA